MKDGDDRSSQMDVIQRRVFPFLPFSHNTHIARKLIQCSNAQLVQNSLYTSSRKRACIMCLLGIFSTCAGLVQTTIGVNSGRSEGTLLFCNG